VERSRMQELMNDYRKDIEGEILEHLKDMKNEY
jgi:hypothetical protein